MITLPIAAVVLLVLAGLSGGWLLGHGQGKHRCVVCYGPLPRVCAGGECGARPGHTLEEQMNWWYGTEATEAVDKALAEPEPQPQQDWAHDLVGSLRTDQWQGHRR